MEISNSIDMSRINVKAYSKLNIIYEMLITCKEMGEKIIIATGSIPVIYFLELFIQTRIADDADVVLTLTGVDRAQQRQDSVDLFNQCKGFGVLLLSVEAGGVGLNIQQCHRLLILEPLWEYIDLTQLIGRIYRVGQTKRVATYTIIMRNTVEEDMLDTCMRKGVVVEALLHGVKTSALRTSWKDLVKHQITMDNIQHNVDNVIRHLKRKVPDVGVVDNKFIKDVQIEEL